MINAINKIQKLTNTKSNTIELNASLPISLKVAEKIGYNRYILKFSNKSLNTRSAKQLNVGAEYWGEIGSNSDNIIITGLYQKPNFDFMALEDGLLLIERLVSEPDMTWFYEYLKQNLITCSQKANFEIYANMLLALQNNIINIGFKYNENLGVFQYKKQKNYTKIYLVFSNFAPLLFDLEAGDFKKITTPFKKVAKTLNNSFECEIAIGDVKPLWVKNDSLIDFKG